MYPALQRVVYIAVANVAPITIVKVDRQRSLATLPDVLRERAGAGKDFEEDSAITMPACLQRGAKCCSKTLYTR